MIAIESIRLCKCGCNTPLKSKRSVWAPGHFSRDPENNKALREALKDAHADPEYTVKLSAALKKKWQSGTRKPTPKEVYIKVGEAVRRAHAEGRVKQRDPKEMREANRKGGLVRTPKKMAQITALGLAKKGVPNIGRGAATEDNWKAKAWEIRSPYGQVYTLINLALWARNNFGLFEFDTPGSPTQLARRVANGIGTLLETSGRSQSYKGWTAVSKLEKDQGGGDLLGRDCAHYIFDDDKISA